MSTTTENINKKIEEQKIEGKTAKKAYDWLNDEIKEDEDTTNHLKKVFINEIKSGLGNEIKISQHTPKIIKKESFFRRLFKIIFE